MDNNQVVQPHPVPSNVDLPQLPPQHDIGRFVGQSWDIYQQLFPKFMQIYLQFFIKVLIAAIPGVAYFGYVYESLGGRIFGGDLDAVTYFFIGAYVIVIIYLSLWWELSLLHAVRMRATDPSNTAHQLIDMAKPQVGGFLWAGFVSGFLTFLWALLLVIPGVIFGVYYSLSEYVYADTGKTGLDAVRTSKAYITGYWWKTVYSLLGLAAVSVLVYIVTAMAGGIAGEFGGSVVTTIVNLIFVPYSIVYICLLYERLKQIKPEISAPQENN